MQTCCNKWNHFYCHWFIVLQSLNLKISGEMKLLVTCMSFSWFNCCQWRNMTNHAGSTLFNDRNELELNRDNSNLSERRKVFFPFQQYWQFKKVQEICNNYLSRNWNKNKLSVFISKSDNQNLLSLLLYFMLDWRFNRTVFFLLRFK